MKLIVTVGLDSPLERVIRDAFHDGYTRRVLCYPGIPTNAYSLDSELYIEDPRIMGHFLKPDAVLFYSYFDTPEAQTFRRAIALSDVPCFPDVRRTLPLDDKVVGLVMALQANGPKLRRGFVPGGLTPENFEGERVFKWGNRHCGENKIRAGVQTNLPAPAVVEPFVEGVSERILLVGKKAWQLRYESSDWRKNVRSTITVLDKPRPDLLEYALRIQEDLGLTVAGIDFISPTPGVSFLLEVNAYPALDDVPEATTAFLDMAVKGLNQIVRDHDQHNG